MRYQNTPVEEQLEPIRQSFCGSLRRDAHWKCLILTVLMFGCLIAIVYCRLATVTTFVVNFYTSYIPDTRTKQTSPCDAGYIYIPVAFVIMLYFVYLVECYHCHTRIELQYKVDVNTVYDKINSMRDAVPILWWKALCYHYVRKTRHITRYRNGDSYTSTQVYYERVNTHTAGSAFNFSRCGVKDISPVLSKLETYPATKIRLSKGYSYTCSESENEFDEQRSRFFNDNERRDDFMETREGMDLLNVNFREYMIAFSDPDNLPWYVSQVLFWIASILLLSWPLRVVIEYKTAYMHYHVHKLFGTHYIDPVTTTGRMTRVNTMGSVELEHTIQKNYAMIPSYSEALLIAPDMSYDINNSQYKRTPRSLTFTSLSALTKTDKVDGNLSDTSPFIKRCKSYSIVNKGLVLQNCMHMDSNYATFSSNTSRYKPRRMFTLFRRDDGTQSNISSPQSPQDFFVRLNPATSSARLTRTGNNNNFYRSTSSISELPANISLPEPPPYNEALVMTRPLPKVKSPLHEMERLPTPQSESVPYITIMETSL
ncbi:transmembrane protein 151B-like [Mytilus edulis]|uniref:Transmembrane protein 151 homolog,Transmembrane protein 151A,Transmembrane protein 151B n=1 Tax=Mytilus edulis TaxID=6550 RepID=A0A8S3UB81_MYTED|nr:Transmembrane protein 151 homolog,Transmembrane protein 151A,Transmembrane protein 151B [Mytilus edulis]